MKNFLKIVSVYVHSVHITTKVVSSNPLMAMCTRQKNYMIRFVSDQQPIGVFLREHRFPPPITIYRHDITDIVLEVALNNITPLLTQIAIFQVADFRGANDK